MPPTTNRPPTVSDHEVVERSQASRTAILDVRTVALARVDAGSLAAILEARRELRGRRRRERRCRAAPEGPFPDPDGAARPERSTVGCRVHRPRRRTQGSVGASVALLPRSPDRHESPEAGAGPAVRGHSHRAAHDPVARCGRRLPPWAVQSPAVPPPEGLATRTGPPAIPTSIVQSAEPISRHRSADDTSGPPPFTPLNDANPVVRQTIPGHHARPV